MIFYLIFNIILNTCEFEQKETYMANIIEKIFKFDKRALAKYRAQANNVLKYEEEMANLTDEQLKDKTAYFRKLFDVPETGLFPVLEALDKVNDVFDDCGYVIVEDKKLPPQTMAQCVPNEIGGFTIEIKNYILKWILVPVLAYLRRYELN